MAPMDRIWVYSKHYRPTWLQRLRLLQEGGVVFANSNMMVRRVPSGEVPSGNPTKYVMKVISQMALVIIARLSLQLPLAE